MSDDQELAEAAEKLKEAKVAADEEKHSRPFGGTDEDDAGPPQQENDEGFAPS